MVVARVTSADGQAGVGRASFDWRRKPRSGGADLSLHIPKLPLYVSPPRAVLQQAATPRALPISRSLSSARNVDDSRKSARANPMTRTLLVWGSNDAKRESPQDEDLPCGLGRPQQASSPQRAATFSAPTSQLNRQLSPTEPLPSRASRSGESHRSVVHAGFLTQRGSRQHHRSSLPPSRRSLDTRASMNSCTSSMFSQVPDLFYDEDVRSERSLGVPEVINGSPRIIEAYSRVHSSQSARSNGWMEDSAGAKQMAPRSAVRIWEMQALDYSQEEVRHAAAVKIQNMMRRAMGHMYLAREKTRGNLVSVPPDRRMLVRSRVQQVFSREVPSYTFEAWRFETPWNPFIIGSKFPLSHHVTLKDKPHPFVRLGEQFDASGLPGASEGHEPLGTHRSWVNGVYRNHSTQVLTETMKAAWKGEQADASQPHFDVFNEADRNKFEGLDPLRRDGIPDPPRRSFSFVLD